MALNRFCLSCRFGFVEVCGVARTVCELLSNLVFADPEP